MQQETYEIIAKYIADSHELAIQWHDEPVTPSCDTTARVLHLPVNLNERKMYGALALLMHEAAHLKYSSKLPDSLVDNKFEHEILNCIEDARIDVLNMSKLPNVKSFYEILYKDNEYRTDIPLHARCLIYLIYRYERFYNLINDPEAQQKVGEYFSWNTRRTSLHHEFSNGVYYIHHSHWDRVKDCIKAIASRFPQPGQPNQQPNGNGEQGEDKKDQQKQGDSGKQEKDSNDSNGKSNQQRQGDDAKDGQQTPNGSNGKQKCEKVDKKDEPEDIMTKHGRPGAGYFKDGAGTGKKGRRAPAVVIREATKNKFKELLNLKMTKVVDSGNSLCTDNLAAFLTGDIDELLKEEKVVKKKKSKILLLLDASGSMDVDLMDGNRRRDVVTACTEHLVKTLEQVRQLEGVNVDWDVAGFAGYYQPFKKATWQDEYYRIGGGTMLLHAFNQAKEQLLKDPMVDGKRLIVLFTDGAVSPRELDEMKKSLLTQSSDIRCMIIGVDAAPEQPIVSTWNILAKDTADAVIMDAVNCML